MQKSVYLFLVSMLLVISLAAKASRYLPQHIDVEASMGDHLIQFMKGRGFQHVHSYPLTSNGTFMSYRFTHTMCDAPLDVTPVFGSTQAVSLIERDHFRYFYRGQEYKDFPKWRYLITEGVQGVLRANQHQDAFFPAALFVGASDACLTLHNQTFKELWS